MPAPDVAVIGAGIIGGSIAWRLAQAGARVALFDAGVMGGEASWAGAGMLAPGGEVAGPSPWAALALESLRLYPAFVGELQAETGEAIDYQRHGGLEIAAEGEWAPLLERRNAQRQLGIVSEKLDARECRKAVPLLAPDVSGALFYPDDALVAPRDVVRALRAACIARGVRVAERQKVLAIRPHPSGVEVETASERISGGSAVLAAGAWSGSVPVLGASGIPRSFPVRGHLLGYRMKPGSLGPLVRRGHTYLLQRAGGLLIAGSSTEDAGFDRTLDNAIVADIAARARALLPCLSAAGRPEAWLGFRPATAGGTPEIGRFHDSLLWLAYGHFRNGILLAPATAARIAREITASSEKGCSSPASPA